MDLDYYSENNKLGILNNIYNKIWSQEVNQNGFVTNKCLKLQVNYTKIRKY